MVIGIIGENSYITLERVNEIWGNIGNEIIQNQNILKLLYYDNENALDSDNLNISQIKNMVGKNNNKKTQRIFKLAFDSDITDEVRSELRFYVPIFKPIHSYLSDVRFNFEVIVHKSLWELKNNKIRPIMMIQELLKLFNGKNIGGVGRLVLDDSIHYTIYGKEYAGYTLKFHVKSV